MTVARNSSSDAAISFDNPLPLSDAVMTPRALEAHTLSNPRYRTTANSDMTWRQAIDVNGDGRIDIIDAAEQAGRWVAYLNTPDPADPRNVRWTRRSFSVSVLVQQLRARGMTVGDFVPLAQRKSAFDAWTSICWQRRGGVWHSFSDAGLCPGQRPPFSEFSITEWELRDINGDGYPDVVFNSSPVGTIRVGDPPPDPDEGEDGDLYRQVSIQRLAIQQEESNHIDAVFTVLGTHLTNGSDQLFSAPVTIVSDGICGVGTWQSTSSDSYRHPTRLCGFEDVNGDGLVDRVRDGTVYLNTGVPGSTGMFTAGLFTLPGPLAVQDSPEVGTCAPPASASTTFSMGASAGLRDINGDGIPDYIQTSSSGGFTVYIGTGAGFINSYPVNPANSFSLSSETEDCGGTSSTVTRGLFDINGDGKPDLVSGAPSVPYIMNASVLRGRQRFPNIILGCQFVKGFGVGLIGRKQSRDDSVAFG